MNRQAGNRPPLQASRAATALQEWSSHSAGREHKVADDRTRTGQADRLRINLNEDYEVRYWTEKWSVSHEELAAAVHEAGVMVKDVAEKLGKEG